jgi:NitT/TauT family transport system ATP-binding protein
MQHETLGLRTDPPPSSEPVVEARGLSISFGSGDGRTLALDGVDLAIERGEFISLIGPSGCGKTTLLRAIADLVTPTAGTLVVNGKSAAEARCERAYGYVFQAPALYPWRNIERNVMLPLEIMGVPDAERRARAARNLELVGLADVGRKFPWQLSGGMQQRASIARALSVEPALLLMDEPFGALDEITRDGLNLHLLELWRRTGMTVVFVTHSIPEAVYLSTRVVVMSPRPGRITDIVPVEIGADRPLDVRDTPAFLAVAHQVRQALHAGRSYE